MSNELNIKKDKSSDKGQTFLGKKTESSNISLNTNLPIDNCRICENKNNLIKCSKCGNNYCKECIKQINRININKIKENEFICSNCLKIEIIDKKNKESHRTICYLCGNKYEEKNLTNYNVSKEQKNDLLNKGLSLEEKEDDIINYKNLNYFKICNNCLIENNEIIGNILNKKSETKKPNNGNIIDELTSIISKDKGETNIFNILDIKSENSSENNTKDKKSKGKDLFDTIVVKKQDKEINREKEEISQDNKNIKHEDSQKIKEENINKFDLQNLIGNDLFLKNLNGNTNKNNNNDNQINKNKNETINNIHNNPSENINNNSLLNSNLLERNVNSFLNMNTSPPSININSNNKTSNIYIPHFFTATPLQNSQNFNPIMPNMNLNNSLSSNLLDLPNINDNLNTLTDINILNNSIGNINNLKNINSEPKLIPNNKYNSNILNKNNVGEENKNILNLITNLNQNNLGNLGNNNLLNFDINQNSINNNVNNLNNIGEGINKLKDLGESLNINNLQSNIIDKNIKKDYLFNSINNKGNNLNVNINNNLIGVNNEIKVTLNKISKDFYLFDNNNIENILNILNNSETLTKIFSQIVLEQNNHQNKLDNNINNINNNQKSDDHLNKVNNEGEGGKENKDNNNDTEKNKDMNLNEVLNGNPSTKALIKYILSVNDSLRKQIRTLKMYIEIQKVFVSIIFQKLEIFFQNLNQNQLENQSKLQKIFSQNKDLNKQHNKNSQNNNILSQMKDLNPQNNKNIILPKINPPPQIPINSLNNLQTINPVPPSNSSLLNSSNLNYNSPIIISPISQFIPNNNIGRNLSLFNLPGQQFKQDFSTSIPNIFNGNPPFPLYPQHQGINSVGNPIIGQNLPQIIPLLNQMNNSGNNNLQFDNQKNNVKNN